MTNQRTLHRSITSNIFSAARLWRRCIDPVLGEHGISEACAAPLIWIGRLGNGVRQVNLAESIGIEGPSLVRLLDQLEGSGLIVRKDDPTDRRAKGLWLTANGEKMAAHMEALLEEERIGLLGDISDADLETTLKVLETFIERCTNMRTARAKGDA